MDLINLKSQILERKKILVIGDVMLDHYIWGSVERISPEAPIPIVNIQGEEVTLGGAGNVLKNLYALGIESRVASVIGMDKSGDELVEELNKIQVGSDFILRSKDRITSRKTRIIAAHQQMLRIDKETRIPINELDELHFVSLMISNLDDFDVVLISDYSKGVLTESILRKVITYCQNKSIPIIVDPKGKDFKKYKDANIIKPNKKEASIASEIDIMDIKTLEKAGFKLKNELNCEHLIITLSEEGMAIFDDNNFEVIPTMASDVFDVTGAGDTVLASLGLCIANGVSVRESCIFANHSAAIVIGKLGSSVATVDEVFNHMSNIK